VQDGAEWLQGLADYHRADAVHIIDFAHATEYINDIGQAAGGRLPACCFQSVLHRLKHQGPARVLQHLRWLAARYPSPLLQEKLTYLLKREAHMQYPPYQEAGWPIGSGSVESANELVVEVRFKGAGMCWCRHKSIPCWYCAMRSVIASGSRPGRPCERTGKRYALSIGKQRANSDWSVLGGSLSSWVYGFIGCLIHLFLFPPHRLLKPSRSNQDDELVLAIPGANPFSDVLFPPLLLQKSFVQNNETRPKLAGLSNSSGGEKEEFS
jgi:hypothetical protein